jgi:hypothetical protein
MPPDRKVTAKELMPCFALFTWFSLFRDDYKILHTGEVNHTFS